MNYINTLNFILPPRNSFFEPKNIRVLYCNSILGQANIAFILLQQEVARISYKEKENFSRSYIEYRFYNIAQRLLNVNIQLFRIDSRSAEV